MNSLDLLKKHYEKIILSVVLIGVIIATILLVPTVSAKKQELAEKVKEIGETPLKPVQPVDLTRQSNALKELENPAPLNFSGGHNLLNPVPWFRPAGGGNLVKQSSERDIGPDKLEIAKVSPLYFRAEYQGTTGAGSLMYYRLQLEDQCAPTPGARRRVQRTTPGLGQRNDLFFLRRVDGSPENPTSLIIEMVREKDVQITITPGRPFERICGYEADLRYPPENNKLFAALRVGSEFTISIGIGGVDTYKIIDIKESEVTIESKSSSKRTTIALKPSAPSP
jgi:hypothetical protein